MLTLLFKHPVIAAAMVVEALECSCSKAYALIERFERLGILTDTTGQKRNRRFRFARYLDLFEPSARRPGPAELARIEHTESRG